MTKEIEDRLTGKRIDFISKYMKLKGQGKTREEMIPLLRQNSNRIVIQTGKILGGGNGPQPPDPPDPPGDRRQFFQIDGMGIFLWFLLYYWDEETRPWVKERAVETIEMFASYKPDSLLFFSWMRDQSVGNAHFRPMCPYPTDSNGLFILDQIKDRYLRGFEEFCLICKNAGLDIQACIFMARYCWFPYQHNVNGVSSFYEQSALPFQVNFIDHLLTIIYSVYGYVRQIRQINEPSHHGQHHRLHVISNWIRDTYKESKIIQMVPDTGMFMDESSSGAVLAPFHEKLDCPKYNPNVPESLCPDGKIGGDLIGFSTDPKDRKPVAIVNHGYSIPQDRSGEGQESYMGSAWPKDSSWWAGGDGGTRHFSLARGHKIHENNDPADPRIQFAQGDGKQTEELMEGVVGDGHKRGRNCGGQLAFFEVLQGSPMIENCQVDQFHRDRIHGAATGHDRGLNTP